MTPSQITPTTTGFTLELKDPPSGLTGALPPPGTSPPGSNVLVVSFDLTVRPDIAIGKYTNRAKVLGYAGTNGGDSYVTPGQEPYDDAWFQVLPRASKSILDTSEGHTTPGSAEGVPPGATQAVVPNIAIGEVVHYHLRGYVPEGKHPNFKLVDTLPPDVVPLGGYPNDIQVGTDPVFGAVTPTVSGGPWSCDAKDLPPKPLVVDFGTLTNPPPNNGPKMVVVDFWARVCNTGANGDDGTDKAKFEKVNRLDIVADGTIRATMQVAAKVVEPHVTIKKTIVTKALPLAVGQTLEYRIEVTNNGTATAFDLLVMDLLPDCLKDVAAKPAAVPLIPASPPAVIAYAPVNTPFLQLFSATISQLAVGQTAVLGYTAALDCLVCSKLVNTATVFWTGLPGQGALANAAPPRKPGASGAVNGERNWQDGPYGVNDYVASAEAAVCGKVCGWKYHDADKDGVFDANEVGLNTWQMTATGANNVFLGGATTAPKPASSPGDPDAGKPGWYCVQVQPGTIAVSEKLKAGWQPTVPPSGKQSVVVGFGETKTGVNFGNHDLSQCKATLCGVKRVDGAGKDGWVIEARKPDGTLVATATTDKDGKYCLTLTGTSEVIISEVPQAGFTQNTWLRRARTGPTSRNATPRFPTRWSGRPPPAASPARRRPSTPRRSTSGTSRRPTASTVTAGSTPWGRSWRGAGRPRASCRSAASPPPARRSSSRAASRRSRRAGATRWRSTRPPRSTCGAPTGWSRMRPAARASSPSPRATSSAWRCTRTATSRRGGPATRARCRAWV